MSSANVAAWSSDQTIVLTGANSDLAYSYLVHLARANTAQQVILTCRTKAKCQATLDQLYDELQQQQQHHPTEEGATWRSNIHFSIVEFDLNSLASARACADQIQALIRTAPTQGASPNGVTSRPSTTTITSPTNKLTLVWNARDTVHDPIRTNVLGHLYVTHLLQEDLHRVVIVNSLIAAVPWNVFSSSSYWPTWLQPVVDYGRGHRATLMIAKQLAAHQQQARQASRDDHSSVFDVIVTHPGLTRHAEEDPWRLFSMRPERGSLSHLRASLDPFLHSGDYVGHQYLLWGRTVVAGTVLPPASSSSSWAHIGVSDADSVAMWNWSLRELGIVDFGRAAGGDAWEDTAVAPK